MTSEENWKIRNEIIDYLKGFIPHHDDDLIAKSKVWITWLEKQGEKIDKLVKYREWLISETERRHEKENDKTNSNAGKHYCIGAANALISARAEFEEIFGYDESWLEKQGEQKPSPYSTDRP